MPQNMPQNIPQKSTERRRFLQSAAAGILILKPETASGSQANSTDIGDPFLTGGPDDSPWPDNGLPSTQQK